MSTSPITLTRRRFLRGSGLAAGTIAGLGLDLKPAVAAVPRLRIQGGEEVPSVCPECAGGCSLSVSGQGGR
ncbi:MAG: twin-arginine translocation signal domain-containing protein, partial [Isosphaeraceae bacterium]